MKSRYLQAVMIQFTLHIVINLLVIDVFFYSFTNFYEYHHTFSKQISSLWLIDSIHYVQSWNRWEYEEKSEQIRRIFY